MDSRVKAAQAQAEAWNATTPVGTPVKFWPGMRDQKPRVGETRTPAWVIPAGEALVSVTGQSGGIRLSHVEPLTCLVQIEFLGILVPTCGQPATNLVTRRCVNGHTTTRPMCAEHVRLFIGDGVGPVDCATCADAGVPDVATELAVERGDRGE